MEPGIASIPITTPDEYTSSVARALEEVNAAEALEGFERVVVKPNLVNGSPPPVTSDARFVRAVVEYILARTDAEVVVAEGSGEGDTLENFRANGYGRITEDLGVRLVDLDTLPVQTCSDVRAGEFREVHLAGYLEGAALVSAPPAKDHSITRVTLGLKNMIGCLHASRYSGYWSYKKSQIHAVNTDQAIADLMLYLRPCVTVIDARQGLKGGHLSGRVPDPPLGRIIAGTDVLAADREATRLLGHDPESIGHLVLARRFR